jgi:hypothetical protein
MLANPTDELSNESVQVGARFIRLASSQPRLAPGVLAREQEFRK